MEDQQGYYSYAKRLKPDAIPPDGINKLAYYDDDWEEGFHEEFKLLSAEEQAQIDHKKKIDALPDKMENVENTQEELVLAIADILGGNA